MVVSPGPVVRCEHCGGLADLAGMEVWEGLKRWRIHRHHPDENVPHCPFIATTADDAVIAAQVRDGLDTLAALRASAWTTPGKLSPSPPPSGSTLPR